MQFSFNPNASSFAPRGQQGSSQADQDGWAGSQRQHKPKPGVDLNAFPSINGKDRPVSPPTRVPAPSPRGTYKSLLTAALATPPPHASAATQQRPSNTSACSHIQIATSPEQRIVKVPQVPVVSHGELPFAPGGADPEDEQHRTDSAGERNGAPRGTAGSIQSTKSGAVDAARINTRRGSDVLKGSYRGSPVVDVRLATDVNHNTVKVLRSVGPSDFQAVREIGQGAFGKVYLVQSRTTRQMYAMKVLNKQRVIQKEQVAYAMGERNVMSSLSHPYLVTLRFAFQTNHRLFLVMDYIEGGHLWTHMKSGFLTEPVAKIFAAEMVLALTHLHSLGIAHRDLKPENILLDSDNHLRLTDFGLAKREMSDDGRAHTMVGTIDYMAPEIVRGDGHGREVDWWSLGILLYEMLCARLPFVPPSQRSTKGKTKGKDVKLAPGTDEYKTEVKKRILNSKIMWPKGPFVNTLSTPAKNLIQRLLAKSPEARLTGQAVMEHEWFKGLDWDKLERREIPSPLRSSIFAGAPDKISVAGGLDMAPIEAPCPRLAGYLFECDTPKGSPNAELIHSFTGFTYIPESELARAVAAAGSDAHSGALADAF